ncbi:DUF6236 family protein [Streptomyces sp. NPDC047841]|uniref:DUF6236 family protein n=1 Tax=Streptomyces sp. NPDC047841 TaxID=3154708 RepID=UPI00345357FA
MLCKIIELRKRHGAEFLAFGQLVEQAAQDLAGLPEIKDISILEQYLNDIVAKKFEYPLADLRRAVKSARLDIASAAINVRTELPAGVALAGGAWLAGHPLIAGVAGAAVGAMSLVRGARHQFAEPHGGAPAVSYLLHTGRALRPESLLHRSLHRMQDITIHRR